MTVIVVFIFVAAILAFAVKAARMVELDAGMINPVVLPTAFIVICLLDFAYLAFDSNPTLWFIPLRLSRFESAWAAFIFGVHCLALYIGLMVGLGVKPRRSSANLKDQGDGLHPGIPAGLAIVLTLLALAIFYTEIGFSLSLAEVSATKAVISEENRLFPLFTWMAVIALGLYLASSSAPLSRLTVIWAVSVLVVSLTGVRTHILTLTMCLLAAYCRRGRGPAISLLPVFAIGGLAVLTFLRFIRASASQQIYSFADFLEYQGGPLKSVFGSLEMATAEITTLVLRWQDSAMITRSPGEGALGMAMGLFPRALAPLKPYPASTEFTSHLWGNQLTGPTTQIVMGSGMELTLEVGPYFAVVGLLFWGFVYGILAQRIAVRSAQPWFSFAAMSLGAIIFLRNDLSNLGVFLWTLLIVLAANYSLSAALVPTVRRSRFGL